TEYAGENSRRALQSRKRRGTTIRLCGECCRASMGTYLLPRMQQHSDQKIRIRHYRMEPRRQEQMHKLQIQASDIWPTQLLSYRRQIPTRNQLRLWSNPPSHLGVLPALFRPS